MKIINKTLLITIIFKLIVIGTSLNAETSGAGTFSNEKLEFVNGSSFTEIEQSGSYYINASTDIVLSDGTTKVSESLATLAPFLGAIVMYANTTTSTISGLDIANFSNAIYMSVIPCDGREVTANWFPGLKEIVGTNWGTPLDSNRFVVPVLDNFYLRGDELSGGTLPNPDPARDINYDTRNSSVTFDGSTKSGVGSYQNYQLQTHKHSMTGTTISTDVNTATHTHSTASEVFVASTGSGQAGSNENQNWPITVYPTTTSGGQTISSEVEGTDTSVHSHNLTDFPSSTTIISTDSISGGDDPKLQSFGLTMFIFAGTYDDDAVNDALGY